jgi:hypothetical protein
MCRYSQPSRSPLAHGRDRQIIDAPARHASQTLQPAAIDAGDHRREVPRLLAADGVMMQYVQRVVGLGHVYMPQRAPCAADHIQITAAALVEPRHFAQIGIGDGAAAHEVAIGAFGEADRA